MEGKPQEIVIDPVSHFLPKLGFSLGLLFSLCLLFLWFIGGIPGFFQIDGSLGMFVLIVLGAVLSVLNLYSLSKNKPILETSETGLMVGGFVRLYCPWSNVTGIRVAKIRRTLLRAGVYDGNEFFPKVEQVVIDILSTGDLLYDNRIHSFLSFLVINNGMIRLEVWDKTTKSPEAVCKSLRERWQQAVNPT